MLRKKAIYDQNGGLDSVTPENRKKLDAMSDEEVRENRSEWRARNEFGLRMGVEGWFSAFKRTVGDEVRARTPKTIEQELLLKVGLYNHMNDAALANGYGGTRVVISKGWTGSKGSRRGKNSKRKERQGEGNAKTATVKAKKGIG